MKHISIFLKKLMVAATFAAVVVTLLTSCEQESVEPELNTAPGGGTVTKYKAYTLSTAPASTENVYGRIVFWKDNAGNTLVQISLYNTLTNETYPTGIYTGTAAVGSTTSLVPLYSIDGTTGEFGTSKFYVIKDKDFYTRLTEYDAYVRILSGAELIAAGNIGVNADPVAESD